MIHEMTKMIPTVRNNTSNTADTSTVVCVNSSTLFWHLGPTGKYIST